MDTTLASFFRDYTRQSQAAPGAHKIDIYDSDYPAHVWLMIFYGFLDSMWQTYAYWLMGAMSNDMAKLAVFTGFCKTRFLEYYLLEPSINSLVDKCIQSSGAAGVWRADGVGLP